MTPEALERVRSGFAFDTETWCVESGVPPMVCCAFYRDGSGDVLGGDHAGKLKALEWYLNLLRGGHTLIALNGPFDHTVMAKAAKDLMGINIIPEIFHAYARQQCYDIGISEQLHALAMGHLGKDPVTFRDTWYSLDDVTRMVLGRTDAKVNDHWRLRYRELDGLPISVWPDDARTYPMDDVRNTWDVSQEQLGRNKNLHDLQNQQYTDWCLRLGALHGLTVDPEMMDRLWSEVEKMRVEKRGTLIRQGYLKVTDKGDVKQDQPYIRRKVALAFGVTGQCKTCTPWADTYRRYLQKRDKGAPKFHGGRLPSLEKCKGPKVPDTTPSGKPTMSRKGCWGETCPECRGEGKTIKTRRCTVCKGNSPETCLECQGKGWEVSTFRACPDCSGTALDLETAPYPTTDKGGIAKGRDALNESGDEELLELAHYDETAKVETTYLPWLRKGLGCSIQLKPRVLKETGRAGYGDVVHQLPRGFSELPEGVGVRECIVARPGHALVSCDWTGAELITHSQSCLWIVGASIMARKLLDGIGLHDFFGAKIGDVEYEYMVANRKTVKSLGDYRQSAKPLNFGLPGMMSAPTMVLQQRMQGPDTTGPDGRKYKGLRFCILAGGEVECGRKKITKWGRRQITPTCARCVEVVDDLIKLWMGTFPEHTPYFDFVKKVHKTGSMVQHVTKRIRSGMSTCATANGYFQGLAGDAMKLAIQRMSWEMYVDKSSDLYGARLILPIHDEALAEVRLEQLNAAGKRLSAVMVGALQDCCPDLAPSVEAEAAAMLRWDKDAKSVYNDKGELVPWTP